jgi:hypothetical protein
MGLVAAATSRYERGDLAGARAGVAAALELRPARDHPQTRARALALSSRLAALAGEHAAARRQIEECLSLTRRLSDRQGLAHAHLLAAHAALDRSDPAEAAQHLEVVLEVARETRDQRAFARGLEGVAELLAPAAPEPALRLVGTAMAIRAALGLEPVPVEKARLDAWLEGARAALGPDPAARALRAGGARPVAAAVAEALEACAEAAGTRGSPRPGADWR